MGEGRGDETTSLFLFFLLTCRDQLKLQLDSQQSSGEALDIDPGRFRFRSKTLATVATNNRLTSGNVVAATTSHNGNISSRQGTV